MTTSLYTPPFASFSSFHTGSNTFCNGPHLSSMPPKLPSLEGILKRIHSENSDCALTDDESVTSSCCYSPPPAASAAVAAPMPSLRSILSLSPPTLAHKRSWEEVSSSSSHHSDAWSSDSMDSPKRACAPPPPQRSRASKYCKIDGCDRVSQRNNLCHSHGGKRLCKEESCSSKDRGNGFCIKHGGGKICSIGGCDKKARRKGLCTQHFRVCDSLSTPPFDASNSVVFA